jgi:hypothetical protein
MRRAAGLLAMIASVAVVVASGSTSTAAAQDCARPKRTIMSPGRPPAYLVDNLAVLRRRSQRGDFRRAEMRGGPLRVIYKRYTRFLGLRSGRRFYLVPGRTGTPCTRERSKPYTCVLSVDVRDTAARGWICTPRRAAIRSVAFSARASAVGDDRVRHTISGLVPDGIARVEATFDDGSVRSVAPDRNLFVLSIIAPATDPPDAYFPAMVRYLDDAGEVVMQAPPPG